MRFQFTAAASVLTAAMLAAASSAGANTTEYQDPVAFHALGPILQVTNFDAFPEGKLSSMVTPYVDGDLTFTTAQNYLIGKNAAPYFTVRNSIISNFYSPLSLSVDAPVYNMLSFLIGDVIGDSQVTLTITTNLDPIGSAFAVAPPPASEAFKFYGFLAPAGQYFTGFEFKANNDETAPGFAEFELGHTGRIVGGGPIPEPASWALMVIGIGGVGAMLRRTRRPIFGMTRSARARGLQPSARCRIEGGWLFLSCPPPARWRPSSKW
jgi:hypothetical protein